MLCFLVSPIPFRIFRILIINQFEGNMENNKIKLGYWAIRGRAQVARLLLQYTHADWVDIQYTHKTMQAVQKPYVPQCYFKEDKIDLGLDFPNVPYLIDGDFKMTESEAIERYIIERSDQKEALLGKDIYERAKIENILGVLRDAFDMYLYRLLKNDSYEQIKKQVWAKIQPKFEYLQKYLGNKQFMLGHLTYVDFIIAERSTFFQTYFPQQCKGFTFLTTIRQNFNKIPQIVQYYQKQTAMIEPYMLPTICPLPF